MKLRTRFLVSLVLIMICAAIATVFTFVFTFMQPAVADVMNGSSRAARALTAIIMMTVPFLWIAAFTLIGAWLFGRGLSPPLAELAAAVEHLKRKDLSFQITYDGRDELGDLCRAFGSMQGELSAALDREWREQEARREMVAAIAHDLRTPLTVVRSHAEGLLAAPPERRQERMERYLTAIAGNAERASQLLTDLLLLSRLEQADLPLQLRPVPLRDLLNRWMADYVTLGAERGIAVEWAPGPAEDHQTVMADEGRLRQVMDNLMENALRHTPPGGQVGVRLRWGEQEATVTVWDTGPGFATADLPHLFDRYVQGGGAVGAAGLGLYICRLLVGRHGGRITAGNRPEGGSQVTFALMRDCD